ncbi:MAG: UDP-N-acetylmuramoyl-L-alanyl-D-glutamate--2,6-diaminopimelate ligase [Candidatus Moraniibacteriota bacterium]|nr:MAG: UDP-N-acetylmuramoyl-L-alanyl-D-glutamate--2,6-diaminopimelate ligase [Candidatus Moranbacteria bacterium]
MASLKRLISRFIPQGVKNTLYHLPLAVFANVCFGFPSRTFTVIGVTGTNGKTTTTKLIAAIVAESGKKTAYASTIEYGIGERHWTNASKFTTSSAWQLQKFLSEAKRAGCTHVVLETSSHAIDQFRTWGIAYTIAVITNVTREHLDYHKTMAEYRRVKRKLFANVQIAIVNIDMEQPEDYCIAAPGKTLTYSTKDVAADVVATEIELDLTGTRFLALGKSFRTKLPGLFNVENALAAITTGQALGIDTETMKRALATATGIPGRMESVPNDRGLDILIDYAVTPDSFEQLYRAVGPMQIPGTKIIHVFGACGERDRGKRPVMGQIASEHADVIILTNEDPYHENPEHIIDEIEAGLPEALRNPPAGGASMRAGVTKKKGQDYFRVFDRREAIAKAIVLAETGDIILITGKGAEETMAVGDARIPWRERAVIEEILRINKNGGD